MKDFKEFLLRGNLVDVAVAFVIGIVFAGVVEALVRDFITPLIGAIFGKQSFFELSFTLNHSHFAYGDFLSALITFVVVAAILFFLVVRPANALMARLRTEPPVAETVGQCPHCLSEIPVAATVCAFCTRDVAVSGV